jgi:hypothetical protein
MGKDCGRPTHDHLVWDGQVYDVDGVTPVGETDAATGTELLEVWVVKRGDGDGKPE